MNKAQSLLVTAVTCISSVGVAQTTTLQNSTATSAAVEPCKQTVPPAAVQREEQKAGGKLAVWLNKKIKTATDGKLDGSDLGNVADGLKPQPKPCVPKQPAPVPIKEVCPVGMQLGADEKGKHLCSDGVHTSEPAKFTPLGPSTPAPVNSSQAPVAR